LYYLLYSAHVHFHRRTVQDLYVREKTNDTSIIILTGGPIN